MKILVVGPSWIGDTIISHSLYQLLTILYKMQIQIDVITPTWCKSILNQMPEINQIFITPYKHRSFTFRKCYDFGKKLQQKNYQQAIILPNSFKSALIPFSSKIPIRTGWKGEMRYGLLNDLRILDPISFPLLVQHYAILAYKKKVIKNFSDLPNPLPIPQLHIKKQTIEKTLNKFHLIKHKKTLIGLCPGSEYGLIKNWPHYHYVELAIKLIHFKYHIIILGSLKDQFTSNLIEKSILKNFKQHYHNLIGQTSLKEAIAIIATCKGIVSNDSGLMHIACALKRPTVGIYGTSNPQFTPPLFHKSKIIYNTNYKNYKIKKSNDFEYGYHTNLINITPMQVLQKLKILLNHN